MLSATMPADVLEVTSCFMRNPIRILVKKEELTLEGNVQMPGSRIVVVLLTSRVADNLSHRCTQSSSSEGVAFVFAISIQA